MTVFNPNPNLGSAGSINSNLDSGSNGNSGSSSSSGSSDSGSGSNSALQKQIDENCGENELANLSVISSVISLYSSQMAAAATALSGITNSNSDVQDQFVTSCTPVEVTVFPNQSIGFVPSNASQGSPTPPTTTTTLNPCVFDWTNFDFSIIKNFQPKTVTDKNGNPHVVAAHPCDATMNYIDCDSSKQNTNQICIPKIYAPFGADSSGNPCSGASCNVQCDGQNCSTTNSITYQQVNYPASCTSDQSNDTNNPCSVSNCQAPGNANDAAPGIYTPNSVSGLQCPVTGILGNSAGNSCCPIGCACPTPDMSLDDINSAAGAGVSTGSILMECPLCKDLYEANNNSVLLKYTILNAIQNWLQDQTIQGQITQFQSSSECTNPKDATTKQLCQLNIANFAVLPPKKKSITINGIYTAEALTVSPSATSVSLPDKNYCVLVDTNQQFALGDIMLYFQLIYKMISEIQENIQNNYQSCAAKIIKTNYYALKSEQLKESLQLIQDQFEATRLQVIATKLGIANAIVSVGMLAVMVMPESIRQGVSDLWQTLRANIANKFKSIGVKAGTVKDAIPDPSKVQGELAKGDTLETINQETKSTISDVLDNATGEAEAAADRTVSGFLSSLEDLLVDLSNFVDDFMSTCSDVLENIISTVADLIPK